MITLYERTDCPFCWKVRLALAELGIEYRSVTTRLGEKHPDVLRLSPVGTVPVLVDGDVVIWESSIALDYIDAAFAPGQLIPPEPRELAAVRSLHAYSDKCVGPALRDLVFEKRSKSPAQWDRELIADSEARWHDCQSYLESVLAARGAMGTQMNAADCALAARVGVAQHYDAPIVEECPALASWFEGIVQRPSWQAAYPQSFIGQETGTATP